MGDEPAAKRAKPNEDESKLVLYSYWRSSCSWRVRIALELKQQAYEYRAVHLVKDGGEQHRPEYAKLNANEVVPTLVQGDFVLGQSVAILEFLDESFPQPALLPADPKARAVVRQMVGVVVSDTQPVQNLRVLQTVRGLFSEKADQDRHQQKWAHDCIAFGLKALESLLEQHAGKYCYGDQVTMADVVLVPQVYNAKRFEVDVASFPTISRVHAELEGLEAFKRAHPSQQPDAPPPT